MHDAAAAARSHSLKFFAAQLPQGVNIMQRKLLTATAAALLLLQLAAVLPVQAGSLRSLKQYWGYDPWAGSGWYGGGWTGGWSRPWDPVGRCGSSAVLTPTQL
jgi:hypothetical protein